MPGRRRLRTRRCSEIMPILFSRCSRLVRGSFTLAVCKSERPGIHRFSSAWPPAAAKRRKNGRKGFTGKHFLDDQRDAPPGKRVASKRETKPIKQNPEIGTLNGLFWAVQTRSTRPVADFVKSLRRCGLRSELSRVLLHGVRCPAAPAPVDQKAQHADGH